MTTEVEQPSTNRQFVLEGGRRRQQKLISSTFSLYYDQAAQTPLMKTVSTVHHKARLNAS